MNELALLVNTPAQAEFFYIAWNKQQKALVSMGTQLKQNWWILIKMTLSSD